MSRYLARRLLQAIPILFIVSLVLFLLVESTPGDPVAGLRDALDPYKVLRQVGKV